MPLEQHQSGPGNRISGPDGNEYDVVARVATDAGPFVILNHADADGVAVGGIVNEGNLRDHEDVVFVSTTAEAKAEAAKKKQDADDAQAAEDRQARIDATRQREADAADSTPASEPVTAPTTDATGTTGAPVA